MSVACQRMPRSRLSGTRPIGIGPVKKSMAVGCGDLIAEREFLSDKVYRRDYRGVLGVESLSAEGLAFVVIHTSVGSGVNLIAPFPES